MDIEWQNARGVQMGSFTTEEGQPCGVGTSDLSQYENLLLGDFHKTGNFLKLTRAEVTALLPHIQRWVATGRLVPSEGIG